MRLREGITSVVAVGALVLTAGSAQACRGLGEPAERHERARLAERQAEPTRTSARVLPALRVTTSVSGLVIPWDVAQLPTGELLLTERTSRRLLVRDRTGLHAVRFANGRIWASGETGLMSIALDRGFSANRIFYLCHGRTTATGHDIAVTAWRLGSGLRAAAYLRTVLGGIQITTGRHGGCRLLVGAGGAMFVGTGDAAVASNPQDRTSLNGKVLRLDPRTGRPWPTNPFIGAADRRARYLLTYGHRNVQGLAQRADGSVWSVEHGSFRDDEVNLLRRGGNYGWDPGPGYDESVPMTDHSLPGAQIDARWSSGDPTIATSGATWVRGRKWGAYDGTLAVAALAGQRLLFLKFDARGTLLWQRAPAALQEFGRLRSVSRARNGDLLVTTSNGSGDRVLRVAPAS